jgi:hypothetical protein
MTLISKLYRMADAPELLPLEWGEIEDLAKFVLAADRPEALLRLGEAALKEGLHEGRPSLVEAGRMIKEEARRWGENRIEAARGREEARRRASRVCLGGLLKAAL